MADILYTYWHKQTSLAVIEDDIKRPQTNRDISVQSGLDLGKETNNTYTVRKNEPNQNRAEAFSYIGEAFLPGP